MSKGSLIRFLELLKHELGADDARAEIGGRAPAGPSLLWAPLNDGWRVVVSFDGAPVDLEDKQQRLNQLVSTFSHTLDTEPPTPPANDANDASLRRLDVALEALRLRAGGVAAVIVDIQSPVLWGSAGLKGPAGDVDSLVEVGRSLHAVWTAGIGLDAMLAIDPPELSTALQSRGVRAEDAALLGHTVTHGDQASRRHHWITCYAVARARSDAKRHKTTPRAHHQDTFGYFARGFANIYLLVVVFDGAFSELRVEASVLHALPALEQLLLALPPLDPTTKGASVLKFKR